MTTPEVIQLAVIVAVLAISYRWLWTWNDREQRNALVKMNSAEYAVAQTGSMFVPSFDPYVGEGSIVYIPCTDGLYPTRIKPTRRSEYKDGLAEWARRGAIVHIIITMPNHRALNEWQQLINQHPTHIFVHLIDRRQLSGNTSAELLSQIKMLDTFHPVLLVNSTSSLKTPGAMWIEEYHPIGSKYAYNVKFRDPNDTAKDERFMKYKHMYENLLNGPQVTLVQPNGDDQATRVAA